MFKFMKIIGFVEKLRAHGYKVEIVVDRKYFLKIYEPGEDRVLLTSISSDSLEKLLDQVPMGEFTF